MISSDAISDLVELSLVSPGRFPGTGELLKNTLIQAGARQDTLSETQINGKIIVSVYIRSPGQASALKKRLSAVRLRGVSLKTRRLRKKDWQERWKKDFYPFALTKTIDIVPLWRKSKYTPSGKRTPIFIDTLTSFGSGLHETTRFMARLIERCRGELKTFFDVGTG
ncbi:MAG TPA: 50S ribosomal protein L11 methyltransferase, partial [Candidatus Omnitrophota bacterium]|nr:50S ribosomal protein L11 methyltransferase [Candidatus Omnitrophota bacterium]